MSRIFVFLIVAFSVRAQAHQPVDGNIWVTGGFFGYATHQWHHRFESPFVGSGGLVVQGDLHKYGGLEISFFYLDKVFSVQKDDLVVTERGKRMYIVMGYRHWFNKKNSAAAGFFSSYSMGDPTILRNDFPAGAKPNTSADDMTEYGFDLSYQHEPISKGRWSAIVDLRYSYSVTPKGFEDSNHYGVLIGLKYFAQSKEKDLDKVIH